MDKTGRLIAVYDRGAQAFADRFMDFQLYNDAFDAFLSLLPEEARVLDIACGPGNVAQYMLAKMPGLKWTGIDLSEKMILLAKENIPAGHFYVRDIRAMGFDDCVFDAGVASFCLPHLNDDEAAGLLAEAGRVLCPGAYLYVSAMEGDGEKMEDASFSKGEKLYFNYYARGFLEETFLQSGFTAVRFFEKEYRERDGTVTKDLIYIVRNEKRVAHR